MHIGRTRTRSGIELGTLDPLQQRLGTQRISGHPLNGRPRRSYIIRTERSRISGETCSTCSWLQALKVDSSGRFSPSGKGTVARAP